MKKENNTIKNPQSPPPFVSSPSPEKLNRGNIPPMFC